MLAGSALSPFPGNLQKISRLLDTTCTGADQLTPAVRTHATMHTPLGWCVPARVEFSFLTCDSCLFHRISPTRPQTGASGLKRANYPRTTTAALITLLAMKASTAIYVAPFAKIKQGSTNTGIQDHVVRISTKSCTGSMSALLSRLESV